LSFGNQHAHLVGGERYGGEEFLLVLNNCKPQLAEAHAEDMRCLVSNPSIQTLAGPLGITMSFGSLRGDAWEVRSVEELLHDVDVALYAAKAAGRNCIHIAKRGVDSQATLVPMREAAPVAMKLDLH